MPIAGFSRFRQWAFSAAQSAHGTAATPSGAFPWRGTPEVNPNWTDIDDVDIGSIDPVLNPYRMQMDTSVSLEGPLDYDSIPLVMAAGVVGGVTGSAAGAVITWAHTAKSLTATALDEFSASWGDDYAKDDFRFIDGVIEEIKITFNDDLGPARISTTWYFGTANAHVTKPASVQLASNLPLVFAADTALFINNTAATIGTTQISDALHSGSITIRNTIDKKRFMNGSNTRFAVAGYGLAGREIEAEFTFAKADAIAGFASTSEMRQFLNADPVTRYLSCVSISRELISAGNPYSWTQNLPLTWRTRGDGEIGGNTNITLMGRARYDPTLAYPYKSTVINKNATLP